MLFRRIIAVLFCLSVFVGCATEANGPSNEKIDSGELVTGHNPVGYIIVQNLKAKKTFFLGQCTLISPDSCVTSAHITLLEDFKEAAKIRSEQDLVTAQNNGSLVLSVMYPRTGSIKIPLENRVDNKSGFILDDPAFLVRDSKLLEDDPNLVDLLSPDLSAKNIAVVRHGLAEVSVVSPAQVPVDEQQLLGLGMIRWKDESSYTSVNEHDLLGYRESTDESFFYRDRVRSPIDPGYAIIKSSENAQQSYMEINDLKSCIGKGDGGSPIFSGSLLIGVLSSTKGVFVNLERRCFNSARATFIASKEASKFLAFEMDASCKRFSPTKEEKEGSVKASSALLDARRWCIENRDWNYY